MGWPSTFEDIQERRDEADHFRRTEPVVVQRTAPEPQPPVAEDARAAEPLFDPDASRRNLDALMRLRLSEGKFAPTRDTVVWRGGARRYTERIGDVFIRAFDRGGPNRAVQKDFKIASKGGGETHLSERIGPRDFPLLIRAMLVADRKAAVEAMTAELARNRN